MHDHHDEVRWAGGLPGQIGVQTVDPYPTTGRPTPDALEAAFEEDLVAWLGQLDAVCVDRRIARVYVIGWLALMATTLAIPLVGIGAAVAAVGVLVTTIVKVWQATCCGTDQVDGIQSMGATGLLAQGRPAFGPDDRAQVVRLMNLFCARSSPVARLLLRAELQEARSRKPLAYWKPLRDLEEVLRTDGSVFRLISE